MRQNFDTHFLLRINIQGLLESGLRHTVHSLVLIITLLQ